MLIPLKRLSVCLCGFPALAEHIPLGCVYDIDLLRTETHLFICGGCGAKWNLPSVWVNDREGSPGGFLPSALFAEPFDPDSIGEPLMSLYVVCERPIDFPDDFTVRRFEVVAGRQTPKPCELVGTAKTLDAARKLIPPGAVSIARHPSDDPVVVETWI